MNLLAKLAVRNLGRRRGRTGLTVAAMAAATILLMLSLGLSEGMVWDLVAGATEMYYGHAAVSAEGYRADRRLQKTMRQDRPPVSVLRDPAVKGWSGRVRGFALLSVGEGEAARTQPAELLGVAPDEERRVSRLADHVVEGAFVEDSAGDGIVLGRGLARRLEAGLGDEVVMMGQAADGSIAAGLLRVVGLVDTGDRARDAALAIVGRTRLQGLLALEGRLHEYALALRRPLEAGAWARGVHVEGLEVLGWNDLLPQLGAILNLAWVNRALLTIVFYFAAILVTANTMYMALLERLREFAIMGAIGLRPWRLARLVVLEGLLLGGLAALAGAVFGIPLTYYFKTNPIDLSFGLSRMTLAGATLEPLLRSEPTLDNILYPIAMTAVIAFVIAFLPARRLFRLRPAEVLREV